MTSPSRNVVASRDGTQIGFHTRGRGPSLLVVHGALGTSDDLATLSEVLSDRFTVHSMDRRGRGMSGPQGSDYCIRKECEDLDAVRVATGSSLLFGHSYGGLAALEASRANVPFAKMALYEPGVSVRATTAADWAWLGVYEQALNDRDPLRAFISLMRGAGHAESLNWVPDWLLRLLLKLGVGRDYLRRIVPLLPSGLPEHREVRRLERTLDNYRDLPSEVLLMSGAGSPKIVHDAIDALEKTLPRTHRVTFPNLDHLAPANGHSPWEVAARLTPFFLG
jgi:pimeloyl-ACP methyl ester carboxylesterase